LEEKIVYFGVVYYIRVYIRPIRWRF